MQYLLLAPAPASIQISSQDNEDIQLLVGSVGPLQTKQKRRSVSIDSSSGKNGSKGKKARASGNSGKISQSGKATDVFLELMKQSKKGGRKATK